MSTVDDPMPKPTITSSVAVPYLARLEAEVSHDHPAAYDRN